MYLTINYNDTLFICSRLQHYFLNRQSYNELTHYLLMHASVLCKYRVPIKSFFKEIIALFI